MPSLHGADNTMSIVGLWVAVVNAAATNKEKRKQKNYNGKMKEFFGSCGLVQFPATVGCLTPLPALLLAEHGRSKEEWRHRSCCRSRTLKWRGAAQGAEEWCGGGGDLSNKNAGNRNVHCIDEWKHSPSPLTLLLQQCSSQPLDSTGLRHLRPTTLSY